MFEHFNKLAFEGDEIDEEFMEEWHIDLEEEECSTWNDAFECDDKELLDMLSSDYNESVVDKFFEICIEREIFPVENAHDDEGNITDEYKSLIVNFYDAYFKS